MTDKQAKVFIACTLIGVLAFGMWLGYFVCYKTADLTMSNAQAQAYCGVNNIN